MASSAISVFPEAVGTAATRLSPSATPASTAASLGRIQLGDALRFERLADARGEPGERTRLHYRRVGPDPI